MILINRKTGEIVGFSEGTIHLSDIGCKNVAEMYEAGWEEYKGPILEERKYWYVTELGGVDDDENEYGNIDKCRIDFGNYFETKEEAEKAVEKLKAWKRLKDKGFRFDGWEDLQAEMSIDDLMLFNRDVINTDNVIGFRMDDYHDCIKDLNTCFGGEG